MSLIIALEELAQPCRTRPKGHQAFEQLLPRIQDPDSVVDLGIDTAEALSASCLDGLIEKLEEAGLVDRVTFLATSTERLLKLSRSAAMRSPLELFYRTKPGGPRLPVPPQGRDPIESVELHKSQLTD